MIIMKNKILIFILSFTFIFTCCFLSVSALDDTVNWNNDTPNIQTITVISTTTNSTTSSTTFIDDTTVDDTTVDDTTDTTNNFTRLEHIIVFFGLLFFTMSFVNFNKGSVIDV